MVNFQKEGNHLKHLGCQELSPLLLSSCITSHDYNDALKILRGQKKFKSTETSFIKFSNEESYQLLENYTYSFIGEYLANCGSLEHRNNLLLKIRDLVLELQRRDGL